MEPIAANPPGRLSRRPGMAHTVGRLGAIVASAVLVVAACGSSTTSPNPSADASVPVGAEPSGSASPAPSAISAGSTGKPGDVNIVWFCCLGTGDAPEQVPVEEQVAEAFNAANPGIHLSFQAYPYQAARDALSVQIASGNGPDIVGPLGIGGANAFHGLWLDLQHYIDKNKFDMKQFPSSTVNLYNVGGEGQVGIPYAIYPSVLFYKASLFKEAGLAEPPWLRAPTR